MSVGNEAVAPIAEGKTKVVLPHPSDPRLVVIRHKNDITAGDGARRNTLPGKGELAGRTTANVFRALAREGIPTHFVAADAADEMTALACRMIPIEVVMRRIATGSYLKRNAVREGTRFDPTVVEFFFKDDANHDPLVDGAWIVGHDVASFAKGVAINLTGTFAMIAKCSLAMAGAAPLNADGQRGVIVSTASVAAEDGQIGQATYAASKAGVMGMTLPLARDLGQYGVRVATILPGLFHTPMFDGLPDEARASLAKSVPFPSRLGDPAEYAQLVQAIVENDMLNGVSIRLDGAIRLAPR